jgi:hypothetical protein
MRKVVFLLAISMMLAPAAGMAQQTALRYVVKPGDVVPGPTAQLITGSVTLTSSPSGNSAMTGGGCLIYTSVPNHKPCDSECATGGGYCANFGPGQQGPMVCWHQPAQVSCHKSPTEPLPVGKTLPFDNPTTPYPGGVQRPIRWRVVTCQNLVPGGCAKPDGTDQDRVRRYGDNVKEFN